MSEAEATPRGQGSEQSVMVRRAAPPPRGRFRSVGWSLGSACPYRCTHCYSRSMRVDAAGLDRSLIVRLVDQMADLGVGTVTLGGNEPIYTDGLAIARSQLPFIVDRLVDRGIRVALVTSGPSAMALRRIAPAAFAALDMVFVSLDAPNASRHDENRGAALFGLAMRALDLAGSEGVDRSILYCATRENFRPAEVDALVELTRTRGSRLRINTFKPVGTAARDLVLDPTTFLSGFRRLLSSCETDLVDDPALRALVGLDASAGCPCGQTTFRISHARADGSLPLAPCIYVESARVGDLVTDPLEHVLESAEFRAFAGGRAACEVGADLSAASGGGCRAHAVLGGTGTVDPLVAALTPEDAADFPAVVEDPLLRERFGGYLGTWMGRPR